MAVELESLHIGFVGAGAMGGAIASGFVRSGKLKASQVYAADFSAEARAKLEELGITTYEDAASMFAEPLDVVFLAVKPQVLPQVLDSVASSVAGKLVVSIAAGVPLQTIEAVLPAARVVRVMPNLPMAVLSGAAAIAPGSRATAEDAELVRALFESVGSAQVMNEHQLDIEGAVVGCVPAYYALFVDAFTRASVKAGLPATAARDLLLATMRGTAQMLLEGEDHPRQFMEKVTSPGGTTACGLDALEGPLMRAAQEAVDAALARTEELSRS